mmetsp:Transcript_15464/g.36766  ORF Transcript_15464/g.36766 Transcript_15464/m.36766 type:complete len:354 (-) Transcript_15464:1202-2263(-)
MLPTPAGASRSGAPSLRRRGRGRLEAKDVACGRAVLAPPGEEPEPGGAALVVGGVAAPHQPRLVVHRVPLPVLLHHLELLEGERVDAVDGAAVHSLSDDLLRVPRLQEHPRPPVVLLHLEGVARYHGAVGAADAGVLVHEHKRTLLPREVLSTELGSAGVGAEGDEEGGGGEVALEAAGGGGEELRGLREERCLQPSYHPVVVFEEALGLGGRRGRGVRVLGRGLLGVEVAADADANLLGVGERNRIPERDDLDTRVVSHLLLLLLLLRLLLLGELGGGKAREVASGAVFLLCVCKLSLRPVQLPRVVPWREVGGDLGGGGGDGSGAELLLERVGEGGRLGPLLLRGLRQTRG